MGPLSGVLNFRVAIDAVNTAMTPKNAVAIATPMEFHSGSIPFWTSKVSMSVQN